MAQDNWPVKLPNYQLDGKSAVVTGGTKGLGYAIAMMLAAFGAKVAISSRHQAECDAAAVMAEQGRGGRRAVSGVGILGYDHRQCHCGGHGSHKPVTAIQF